MSAGPRRHSPGTARNSLEHAPSRDGQGWLGKRTGEPPEGLAAVVPAPSRLQGTGGSASKPDQRLAFSGSCPPPAEADIRAGWVTSGLEP